MLSLAGTSGPDGTPADIDSEELARVMEMQRHGSEEEMMEMALRMSQEQPQQPSAVSEEDEIQKAIALSLEGGGGGGRSGGVSREEGGWGSRLREQEVEEEERWLQEQERARQEEEKQLEEALRMSMETSGTSEMKRDTATVKPRPDPVQTAWPVLKNPPPGSLAAGPTTSPTKPPSTSTPSTPSASSSTPSASSSTPSASSSGRRPAPVPVIPEGPGHRLGEAGGSRSGSGQPRAEDPQEIRRRRMAFLDKLQKSPKTEESK